VVLLVTAGLIQAGCEKSTRIVYLDDQVPLATPLDGTSGMADGDSISEKEDPPSRVARVSFLTGPVSVQPGGVDDWEPAQLNLPLKGGDALWAAQGSRAELQVGPTGLRAAEGTSMELVRIEDGALQVGLNQGSVLLHTLPGAARDAVEVDTPAGAVSMGSAGTYRIDMQPDRPDGSVTVRSGHADVTMEGEVIPVGPGKRLRMTGGDAPAFVVENAPAPDPFETWSEARDARAANSVSNQKLGSAFTGVSDLDGAGTWKPHPEYGDIWVPTVQAGWAPYRNGRWTWVDPWGWTWVDDAPWGFATSHYGRWAHLNGSWAWVPRTSLNASGRPVYAPALVGFVGQPAGPRHDQPISGGGVAWFPLGPREPYAPAYPASRNYFNRLNPWVKAEGAPKTSSWVNRSVPGAVTLVPRSTFTSFAPVASAALPMGDPRNFRSAPVGPAPALAPTLHSVLGGANPEVSRPPAEIGGRPLLARTPLPARPLAFAARQQVLQSRQGRPLGFSAVSALRRQGPMPSSRPWHGATMHNAPAPLHNRAADAAAGRTMPQPAHVGEQGGPTRRVEPWELNRGGQRQGREQPNEGEREPRQAERPGGNRPGAGEGRPGANRPGAGEGRPRANRPAAGGGRPEPRPRAGAGGRGGEGKARSKPAGGSRSGGGRGSSKKK
jgi:hypothetical protein